MNGTRTNKGFTLVELLGALFILGLLVSLVSVGVSRARFEADKAVSAQNIRQLVTPPINSMQMTMDTSPRGATCRITSDGTVPELPVDSMPMGAISAHTWEKKNAFAAARFWITGTRIRRVGVSTQVQADMATTQPTSAVAPAIWGNRSPRVLRAAPTNHGGPRAISFHSSIIRPTL